MTVMVFKYLPPEQTELLRLRQDNQRLVRENALLKAALADKPATELYLYSQQLLAAVAEHEASLKALLDVVLQQKHDLEIIGDILAEHGDSLDAQWYERFQQVKQEAYIDSLTGIANRRRFDATLQRHISRHCEHGISLSLVLIDIDDFKQYNDQYGHPAGDACLQRVAELLGQCLPGAEALAARYGGEEFACLLPGVGLSVAIAIAEHIRTVAATQTDITVSCGVASTETTAASHLIQQADAALYRAKANGRNIVISAD
ncbi:MAG: GGDEF domain-containing protein [Synechococcaceae cyanobacterium SM2_3_60]|nr:GGDEF domain-containing protein [Synechococcaceae cyanobacterium SM2_3_60]